MADFFGRSSTSSSTQAQDELRARLETLKAQVRQEMQMNNAQGLVNKLNEKCYAKCVPKPGSSLSSSEETCLTRCMDMYMQAFNVVSRTYTARLAKERGAILSSDGSSL